MQLTHYLRILYLQILPPLNSSVMSYSARVALVWSFGDVHRMVKNCRCPAGPFPAETEQGARLTAHVSSVSTIGLSSLFSAPFFFFCHFVLFLGDITVSNGPKQSAEALSGVPECRSAMSASWRKRLLAY